MNHAKIVDIIMNMISGFTDEQRNSLADKIRVEQKQKYMLLNFCKEIGNRMNEWTIIQDADEEDDDFIADHGENSFIIDLIHDDKCYLYLFFVYDGEEAINVGSFDEDKIRAIQKQLFMELESFRNNGSYDEAVNLLSTDDLKKYNEAINIFTLIICNDSIVTGDLMDKYNKMTIR